MGAAAACLCMRAEASGVAGTGWQRSCLGTGAGLAAGGPACAVTSKLSWCPGCAGLPAGASADVTLRSASSCSMLHLVTLANDLPHEWEMSKVGAPMLWHALYLCMTLMSDQSSPATTTLPAVQLCFIIVSWQVSSREANSWRVQKG